MYISYLSIGRKISSGNLKRDGKLCSLVHFLRQEVGFSNHGVCPNHFLFQFGQALFERALSVSRIIIGMKHNGYRPTIIQISATFNCVYQKFYFEIIIDDFYYSSFITFFYRTFLNLTHVHTTTQQ